MGNGSDAKEIYQAVLEEIRSELPNMLIQYKESIQQTAKQQYIGEATYSKQQVADMMERMAVLEKKNEQLEGKIANLEQQMSKSEREGTNYSSVRVSANSTRTSTKIIGTTDMSRYDIRDGYKFNGWVYYANEEMGNFLYKVRTNGTDNQQLTDYSVDLSGCKVKNGKLYFDDYDYKEHSIDI